jgi:hypothetical protein
VEKKHNAGLTAGQACQAEITETVRTIFFLAARRTDSPAAAGKRAALGLGEEGTGGDGELQSGGGAPPLPPCPDGGSRKTLERRERLHVLELGLLRRGRCEGLEGKGVCLGGCWRWCGSFQANRGSFYRREREHGARGSAERARLVSANEGTRRSGLSARGCGVLWGAAGALAGCGVVWCRGSK